MSRRGDGAEALLERQIEAAAEAALRRAGVLDVLPTPLDSVARAAGVAEVVDLAELPDELRRARPPAMSKILGAYLFAADTAFVDGGLGANRARFVQAHETAHRLLPWHAAAFHLDDAHRLSGDTEERLEREANRLASHLIFQGPRFDARTRGLEPSLRGAQALARAHGASFHATLRRLVERHPDPVALLATGRDPSLDGTLVVRTTAESPAFRHRFGGLSERLLAGTRRTPRQSHPRARLQVGPQPSGVDLPAGHRELGSLVDRARLTGWIQRREIGLLDRRGELHGFLAEALRQWSVLVLLTPLHPARPAVRAASSAEASP